MDTNLNKLDYSGKNIYAGFDAHKKNWTVTIRVGDSFYKTFSQDPKAVNLANYLKSNFPGGNYFSAYEAGFCGFSIHGELISLGVKNIVVNPADIPTSDKDKKQKEDKRDSRKISLELSKGGLTGIYVPGPEHEAIRSYLRLRKRISKDLTRNKNRLKSFLDYCGIEIPTEYTKSSYWSKNFVNWIKQVETGFPTSNETLNELLDMVEYLRHKKLKVLRKIRGLSRSGDYKTVVNLLITIPGIGRITAMIILTEILDMQRFPTNDHLCSFAGLVPMTNSTGDNERVGKITNRRNEILREAIIESSWVAIRNDPALMLAYSELIKRMKGQKAIIKIAKKLLSRVRYVLENEKEYVVGVVK
jgi:transposase